MHYSISQNGAVYDGDADVTFSKTDAGYRIDWRLHVRLGTVIKAPYPFKGERFAGEARDMSGSKDVSQAQVDALYSLKVGDRMDIDGADVTRQSLDMFSFGSGPVSGSVSIVFAGPEITMRSAVISALGNTISLD